jgi:site-specific DNA recombinase
MEVGSIPAARQRRKRGVVSAQAENVAGIYVRVSLDRQVQDDGGSLESQEARCRALCEARGLTVGRVYVDAGHSGGTLDRPALTELRADVAAGHVAVVVVYAVDRFSRMQAHLHGVLAELESHGAGLVSASQDFDTTSAMGKAMLGMLGIFGELQRSEIRSRTKAALDAKKAKGEATNRLPLGLARDGKGYRKCEETWPIVARILSARASGQSCQRIADDLNDDGVPTATALRGQARGLVSGPGQWHAAAVASLCRNPNVLSAAAGAVA